MTKKRNVVKTTADLTPKQRKFVDVLVANWGQMSKAEIENLTSLCLHDNYNELWDIIYNKFGYKDLTDEQIEEQYQVIFEEEENPDTEPDYNAKTSQELSDEQREIYRTLK